MGKRQFAVIGLGNFGYAVAKTLAEKGCQIICIDESEERLERVRDIATHAVEADATDDKVLREVGVAEVDCAVVSLGRDMEASLLVAMALRDVGVKMLVVKAVSTLHGRILKRLGVDRVVFPEAEMGRRVAETLVSPSILDYLELGEGFGVAEVDAPKTFWEKSLADLALRTEYGVTILAIRRASKGERPVIVVNPSGAEVIREGDILVVIGENVNLGKLSAAGE
ncbi:MAG: TrkA family potassium uptake protein [candidate division NC10 bacterium]|nr:TrkA family potassium uptake protein [candidate division NC10 bacterium]